MNTDYRNADDKTIIKQLYDKICGSELETIRREMLLIKNHPTRLQGGTALR